MRPAAKPAEVAEQYRGLLAAKQVLIVADNARDARQPEALKPPEPNALLATEARGLFEEALAFEQLGTADHALSEAATR